MVQGHGVFGGDTSVPATTIKNTSRVESFLCRVIDTNACHRVAVRQNHKLEGAGRQSRDCFRTELSCIPLARRDVFKN